MRPTRNDASRWALAGLSVFWLGCGGGDDVPDPESDSTAAVAGAPTSSPVPAPAAQAPAPAPAPEAAPVAENPVQAAPATASVPPPAGAPPQAALAEVTPTASAAEPVEEPAAVAAAPVSGATSEMLALSKGAATPIAEGDPANPGAPAPGAPTTPQTQQQQMMMAGRAAARDQPPGNPFNSQQQMQGPAGMPGGMPGSQRAMDGFSGAGSTGTPAKPGDYRTPMGAVTAFVDAVKAKDRDSLLEATAMRASRIAAVKNQRLFGSILDGSISDEDLDDLAEIFKGYTVSMKLPAHNTGESSVLLTKTEGRKQLTRRVEVRHEKAGWKVCDFTGYRDMQSSGSGIRKKSK